MASESEAMNADESSKLDNSYRDYSQVTSQEEAAIQPLLQMGVGDSLSIAAGSFSDRNFPAKLHFVLSELDRDGMTEICGWQPHGRCFIVHQHQLFIDLVLRKWFRQTKFASFQRQLNIYGFSRITFGPDKNAYYNEFFLRSKPFLATRIPRLKVKGTGPRRPSSFKSEPNFYTMPFLPVSQRNATCAPQILPQVQLESLHRGVGPTNNTLMLLKSTPEQMGTMADSPFSGKRVDATLQMGLTAATPLQAFLQGHRESMDMLMPCLVPKNNTPVLTQGTLAEHVLSLSRHRMAEAPPGSPGVGLSQADIARALYMQTIASRRQSDAMLAAASIDPRVYAMAQDLLAQRQRAHMLGENVDNHMRNESCFDGTNRR